MNGQALVEYIMIFGIMAFIGMKIIGGLGEVIDDSIGSLNYALTQQLSTGVCSRGCFFSGYKYFDILVWLVFIRLGHLIILGKRIQLYTANKLGY